ncbi:MAG TPA: GyrI-like domain-containing protein [Sideroxyarcus sp.]|nr:GyrI-like domain-containing protein [Sideroxyarcus sp.]
MQPRLVELQPFILSGISIRTSNSEQVQPSKATIGGLWQRFMGQGLADKIPDKLPDSPLYGVYSGYESDANGQFTATVAVAVSAATPAFDTIEVGGGRYLVFEARGAIPQSVIDAWGRIWPFFESSKEWKRRFAEDFEVYRNQDKVEIYIGIE